MKEVWGEQMAGERDREKKENTSQALRDSPSFWEQ